MMKMMIVVMQSCSLFMIRRALPKTFSMRRLPYFRIEKGCHSCGSPSLLQISPAACCGHRVDHLTVGASLELRHQHAHDLAHVLRRRSARLLDGFLDKSADLVLGKLCRQIRHEHVDLGLRLRDEVLAAALLELLDGVLAHFDFLADDADDVLIAELFVAAIDLGLTDGTAHEADDRQAVLIVALHGFFHISCKLFLDRHD